MRSRYDCECCGHPLLNVSAIETFEWVERNDHGITSREVTGALHLTLSAASNRLRSLCEKGWLDRSDRVLPDGGHEFVYRVAVAHVMS